MGCSEGFRPEEREGNIAVRSSSRLCARERRAARVPDSTMRPDATSSWILWEGFPKEFGVLDDLFKVRSHCVTEVGELNAGNVANEKLTADLLFESLNGCTQRWLCDVAPSGRPREAQLLTHRKEVVLRISIASYGADQKWCRRKTKRLSREEFHYRRSSHTASEQSRHSPSCRAGAGQRSQSR